MACPISAEEIAKLKMFIQVVAAQPQILNIPQLDFFKHFVESLGGKVPEGNFGDFEHSRLVCMFLISTDHITSEISSF